MKGPAPPPPPGEGKALDYRKDVGVGDRDSKYYLFKLYPEKKPIKLIIGEL